MLDTLRRCATVVCLLLLGACNGPLLFEPPEACKANTFTSRFANRATETTTVIFVLDDSGALEPHGASVRRAILDAVRRFVDLPCDVDAALAGADCDTEALDRRHYRDFGFAVLFGGYEACGEPPKQPLGRLLQSAAAPAGVFEWRSSEFAELSDAGPTLGKLLRDLDEALTTVEFSPCHVPQPLEALYALLAKPEPPAEIERFRAYEGVDFLRIVMLLGSDDQSGWPGPLYPVLRYVNFFDFDFDDTFCPEDPTLSSTSCAEPVPNPTRGSLLRRASMRLVGPAVYPWPYCELEDPIDANKSFRAWSPPSLRVEQVVETVGYGPADSHPWCFEANAAPDSDQFLFPTFNDAQYYASHIEPFMCVRPSFEFEEDPDSPVFGQANCFAVEAHRGDDPTQCACEGSHRAPLREEIREVVEQRTASDKGVYACYCELFQLSGPDLWDCQNVDAPPAIEREPAGYCLIDPARGFGDESRVSWCSEESRRVMRFLGRDVPAPASHVFLTCSSEQCESDAEGAAPDVNAKRRWLSSE